MTLFIRIATILGTLVLLVLGYAILNFSGALVTTRSIDDHAAFLTPHVRMHFPEGEGPFPTVVQFHGCGSSSASQDDWAAFFVEHGFGAVIVDSLAPRNIDRMAALSTVCTAQQLPGQERAGDVIAGLAIARALPWVDAGSLFVGGWSHGGWAIMDMLTMDLEQRPPPNLQEVPSDALAGVRGAILFYPYSGFPAQSRDVVWRTDFPVLAFAGTADIVANPLRTEEAFAYQQAAGQDAQLVLFDGATHDFDVRRGELAHQGEYDEDATERARGLTLDFLNRNRTN